MIYWKLKEIARAERWSARRLAASAGLAYSTVYGMWDNRTRRADLDTLEALAAALGVSVHDLIGVRTELPPTES